MARGASVAAAAALPGAAGLFRGPGGAARRGRPPQLPLPGDDRKLVGGGG